ncbi:MAG: polyphosphate kinase 1, partial [Betaproteobacteria bacterium]
AKALNAAAEAGAQVDLCVRGACILRPIEGKGSHKGRIRVRSIIGRFLEHSRVYSFSINGVSTLYLSSADMMSRNMHGRIEIAWPIEDEKIKKTIFKECLELPFDDTKNGWSLELGDKYRDLSQSATKRKTGTGQLISSQEILMNKYGRA